MLKKNDELIGTIVSIGSNGEGIIRQDGIVVFVPFSLVGEKVKYKILKVNSKCAYGKVMEVLTPAENRVRPKCPVFGRCGGCQLQHAKYTTQLKIKEDNVKNCFSKIAGLNVEVLPTVKSDNEYGYRNKLQLPVEQTDKGAIIGFYAEGSHRVVEIDDCAINQPWTGDIIRIFKKYFSEFNIRGYGVKDWDVREITVRSIKSSLIITLVVSDENIRGIQRLIEILSSELKYEFSFFINVNNDDTNVIYGDKFILKHGAPFYKNEMLGIKNKCGVQSFMQINDSVCSKLYSAVKKSACIDEDTTVIDAYSGAGLMTTLLATDAKKTFGIEIIQEAVDCANEVALTNGVSGKVQNICGKCEEIMPDIITEERKLNNKICVVLDPPRKGCDASVINALIDAKVDRILYVSCMPSTLARDVGLICGSLINQDGIIKKAENFNPRYNVTSVRTFDMFPQTKHVETLVVLTRAD